MKEHIVNNFPNGLYGHNTTEKQCNRISRIPEIMNSFEEKGRLYHTYANEMKGSLEAFSKQLA